MVYNHTMQRCHHAAMLVWSHQRWMGLRHLFGGRKVSRVLFLVWPLHMVGGTSLLHTFDTACHRYMPVDGSPHSQLVLLVS
mmetsp:Transcript_22108/g.61513  ORF Transcript_22108/g.61513 Transcript_22108/m.61513 type:complete len:81 (-) Transcript_22108:1136-1378(-)